MAKQNESKEIKEEQVSLFVLNGTFKNKSMLAIADKLLKTLELQQWRGWFEPVVGPRADGQFKRDEAFTPWTTELPSFSDTPQLSEIRMGGCCHPKVDGSPRYGGFHLVNVSPQNVEWFAFSEQEFCKHAKQIQVIRRSYPVLQRTDSETRFFTDKPKWLQTGSKFTLVEYWLDAQVYAWLVTDELKQGGK